MNKGRRQELKKLKYIKRIRRFVAGLDQYVTREGVCIKNPKTHDVIDDNGQLAYKNTSTPCSCWMCSYPQYDRNEFKKQTKLLINEELEASDC